MITDVVQRADSKRPRRIVYRPAREVIDPRAYEVAQLHDDRTPREFIRQHHYIGTMPAARFRFGLFWGGLLVGAAVFSHPANDRVLSILPCDRLEGVELGRLVLLDRVPANGESFFVARCFDVLRREGIRGVVSFSDPMRREAADGRVICPGHVGTVYQALTAVYSGRSAAHTVRVLANGQILGARTISKIRAQEQGHEYAEEILVRAGAAPRRGQDPRAWLKAQLPRVSRTQRHPGCHRYLFGLDRLTKKYLPAGLPYPKVLLPEAASP